MPELPPVFSQSISSPMLWEKTGGSSAVETGIPSCSRCTELPPVSWDRTATLSGGAQCIDYRRGSRFHIPTPTGLLPEHRRADALGETIGLRACGSGDPLLSVDALSSAAR